MKKTFADYGIENPEAGRTTCPQCSPQRHKSWEKCLSVDVEKGVWYCHHCGWAGGLGGKFDREEVVRHFTKPKFEYNGVGEKEKKWFASRGISERTLSDHQITSGPAWMHGPNGGGKVNTIQFPFYFGGEVVNIKYRTGDKRFRQEKNARKTFFGYDMAMKSPSETVVIVEGEMDKLALYECGYRCVVSVPDGAPAPNTKTYATKFDFLEGSEPLFEGRKWVVLAGDNDAPGKKLVNELARRLGSERCKVVSWPEGCKDANDVLMKHGKDAVTQCVDLAKPLPVEGVICGVDLYDKLVDKKCELVEDRGVNMHWIGSAEILRPETGLMYIVTGIPSHGKSTWLDAMRVGLLREHGWKSAACSPENWPAEDHMSVLMEMYSQYNFKQMDTETFNKVFQECSEGFFFLQPDADADMLSVEEILDKAKALIFRHGIKMLIMDPWNEILHNMSKGEREDQYISRELAKIRRFARTHDIAVFIVAHPKQLQKDKDGTYPVPTAYDIAGGAMWYNKADVILCVHRPDVRGTETHVYVQKVRFRRLGRVGGMEFNFERETSTYYFRNTIG